MSAFFISGVCWFGCQLRLIACLSDCLLDLNLPSRNGCDAIEQLRLNPLTRRYVSSH
jgi:CheY-like chemotaxis protein